MSSENVISISMNPETTAGTFTPSDHIISKQQQQQQQLKISSTIKPIESTTTSETKSTKAEAVIIKEPEKKDTASAFVMRRRRDRRGSSNNTTNDGRKWKRRREGGATHLSVGLSSGCSSSSSSSPGNSSPGSCSSSSAGSCSSSDGEDDEVLGASSSCTNSPINGDGDKTTNPYDGSGNSCSMKFDNNNNSNSPSANTIGTCIENPLHHPMEEEVVNNDDSNNILPEEEKSAFGETSQQQPVSVGWRVKLYRLNTDGSWDDCGTGRINCDIGKEGDSSKDALGLEADDAIYAEIGDPTLSMLTEPSNTNTPKSEVVEDHSTNNDSNTKVLLKTRVLLREAYQRQGDNIITWCEPSFSKDHNISSSILASAHNLVQGGVDLALSFQDNAGCLEIWKQITEVQARAMDVMRNRAEAANATTASTASSSIYESKTKAVYAAAAASAAHYLNQDNRTELTMMSHSNDGVKRDDDGCANSNPIPDTEDDMASNTSTPLDPHHAQTNLWNQIAPSPKTANTTASSSSATFDNGEVYPDNSVARYDNTSPVASHSILSNCGPTTPSFNAIGDHISSSASTPHLPTPTLLNLEEVADLIAAAQMQQREQLAILLSSNECAYLLSLLSLFPYAEEKDDFRSLATLAACIKSILLLNDPTIIELIVSESQVFEHVCSVLEYDPDLRIKANHRWFIRERSKFRTVIKMENEDLVHVIFRSFRVSYLRDTLLRPTMDESSLSTLASLFQFTHADVVRGVTCTSSHSSESEDVSEKCMLSSDSSSVIDAPCATTGSSDSYLVKVMRMLGRELSAIHYIESNLLSVPDEDAVVDSNITSSSPGIISLSEVDFPNTEQHFSNDDHDQRTTFDKKCIRRRSGSQNSAFSDSSSDINSLKVIDSPDQTPITNNALSNWKQHLLPQDESLSSRKLRRKGSLSFLKELFHMVRSSLQQNAKDDFYNMIVLMDVPLLLHQLENNNKDGKLIDLNSSKLDAHKSNVDHVDLSVNLLSLLGSILSDTNTGVLERSSSLEILSAIVIHDPSLIRRHCLDFFASKNNHNDNSDVTSHVNSWPGRPQPKEHNEVMFRYGPDDLLLSLLHVMAVEKDAGLLLQASEIMRIILDTEMLADHNIPLVPCLDECDINSNSISGIPSDQNSFLAMFYEHYIQWLLVPFQYTVLIPVCCPPFEEQQDTTTWNTKMQVVASCAVRACFTIELLSFCVRAHCYRMKAFVLKNRILSIILILLSPSAETKFFGGGIQQQQQQNKEGMITSGGRCLTLAALRFLRSALSIKDEFYDRHIIQNNLFKFVFEAFRANPVGDNLVASSISEMCDFIRTENIESLMEHIVTKHLSPSAATPKNNDESVVMLSLEEVATPYVKTFTLMREKHSNNINMTSPGIGNDHLHFHSRNSNNSDENDIGHFFDTNSPTAHQHHHNPRVGLSQKAVEDQRKFRENDEEDSYFNDDDDDAMADVVNTSSPSLGDDGFQFGFDKRHAIDTISSSNYPLCGSLLNEDEHDILSSTSNNANNINDTPEEKVDDIDVDFNEVSRNSINEVESNTNDDMLVDINENIFQTSSFSHEEQLHAL